MTPGQEYELAKLKYKLSVKKFWIVTVGIGLITIIFNFTIQWKELRIQQIQNENTHLSTFTEQIIDKDLEVRRDIALYFSELSYNNDTRTRWYNYLTDINDLIEQKRYLMFQINKNVNIIDSLKAENLSRNLDTINNLTDSLFIQKELLEMLNVNNEDDLAELEKNVYDNILNKNYDKSIYYLDLILNESPYYKSVYEIKKLLKSTNPSNNNEWDTIFQTIGTDYTWKMTDDYKNKFKKYRE